MATTCNICQRPFHFFERFTMVRCPACIQRIDQAIGYWKNKIWQGFHHASGITPQTEQQIKADIHQLPIDVHNVVLPYLAYYRSLSDIRWGNVRPIQLPNIHLTTNEHAYFLQPATFVKQLKQTHYIPGDIIGTDKSLLFISHTGKDSNTMEWGNIAAILENTGSIRIEMKKSKGGLFQLNDTLYVKVFCDMLVQRWNKRIILQREQAGSRIIPEYIRLQVLEKYQHQCANCGASGFAAGVGLEMDHIQPFSKGGASTLENLQPLCGPCNKRKSNRL